MPVCHISWGQSATVSLLRLHRGKGSQETANDANTQIIVRYKAGANRTKLQDRITAAGAEQQKDLGALRVKVLRVPAAKRQQALSKLKADPNFESAEEDRIVHGDLAKPNDTYYSLEPAWPRTMTDIAWGTTKGDSLTVATVDTGFNYAHPDLAGKAVGGIDYVNLDNDPTDDNGHGSAVAGTIAAITNNNTGVAGGCWNCKILPIKVLDSTGSGTLSNFAQGIQYAADNGAKIISASVSASGTSATLQTAVNYAVSKGAIVVSSAGNTGTNQARIPASYSNVIAVAAVNDYDDELTSYSTYGNHVDIAAPGDIKAVSGTGTSYATVQGTSFSTPAISAIVALLWSAFPSATASQIRAAPVQRGQIPCCSSAIGGGRANAARALVSLAGSGTVSDTASPSLRVTTPAEGATISGSAYHITGTATDNGQIAKVEMQIDNGLPFDTGTLPYDITLNTTVYANGNHTLTLTAYDVSGNVSNAITRLVNISNASSAPSAPLADSGLTGDFNHDNQVNLTDMSAFLSNWGITMLPTTLMVRRRSRPATIFQSL